MSFLSKLKPLEKKKIVKVIKDQRKVVIFSMLVGSGGAYFAYKNFTLKDETFCSEEKSTYIYLPSERQAATPIGLSNNAGLSSITEYTLKGIISHKLLKLTRSENQKVKNKAISDLACTLHLEDFQYNALAQVIDMRTSIGISRTPNCSLKFFLSPSPLLFHPKISNEEHLMKILSALPISATDTTDRFVNLKTREAIDLLNTENEFHSKINIFGSPDIEQYYQKNHSPADYRTPLVALLSHSTVALHRHLMVQKRLLPLLHTLYKSDDDDDEIKILIAQIIANIAVEEKFHQHIFKTGWLGILASWSRSSNDQLSSSAAKALANMDRSYENNNVYDDGIYLLYPQFRVRNSSYAADVVFVHGIMGGAFSTWRQHDNMRPTSDPKRSMKEEMHFTNEKGEKIGYSYCWPKDWLPKDLPFVRVIAVNYNSHFTEWKKKYDAHQRNEDLHTRSTNMLLKLKRAGVGKNPVIFVGHSMGGIIVKKMLVEAAESDEEEINDIAQNTIGVVFYSVPHKGTEVASFSPHYQMILKPSAEIQHLKKGSPQLLELHENFKRLVDQQDVQCLSFGETIKSKIGLNWNAILVPNDSADPDLGKFYEVPTNHLSSCKPLSRESASYVLLVEFIKKLISKDARKSRTETACTVFDWFTFF